MNGFCDDATLEGLRSKCAREGMDSLSDKEMQILIAGYFNHKVGDFEKMMQRAAGWVVGALLTIALGVMANLVVALLTKL